MEISYFFDPMRGYYYKFSDYLKERYGSKVWKIPVDAGFGCPHKECETGQGGCIYCRLDSFSGVESLRNISVKKQIEEKIFFARERLGIDKFIVYFQASTNTFAPVSRLRELFYQSIDYEGVVGLSISTRPDCLPPKIVDLIVELGEKIDLWIELGLQSVHDKTLRRINRGHSYSDYLEAIDDLGRLNVRICTHLMFGLPGESDPELKETAQKIANSPIHEVKIHPLLVLKETRLAELYQSGEFRALELNEYIKLLCDFIERMPERMVMQRLTAEAPREVLIVPQWSRNKINVLNQIDSEFRRRGSRQGSLRGVKKI